MIERWSECSALGMDDGMLVGLYDTVHRHPWWRARASLVLKLLAKLGVRPSARVLDAGCGWGVTLEALERAGYTTTGLDASRAMLERLDRDGRRLIEADVCDLRPIGEPFDVVLALDVIEHLDHDSDALRGLGQLVAPGGWLLVSVPALPGLYSEFDAIQGHRRRYTRKSLAAAIESADLSNSHLMWWGCWLTPLLGWQRRRARARAGDRPWEVYARYVNVPPAPVRPLLKAAFAVDGMLALAGLLPLGTSLFAVVRKNAAESALGASGRTSYNRIAAGFKPGRNGASLAIASAGAKKQSPRG